MHEERRETLLPRERRRLRLLAERLWRHRRALLQLFLGVLVPLCALALIARWVVHPQPPPWDVAILEAIHAHASPERDRIAVKITDLGTWAGVAPVSIALGVFLAVRRRVSQLVFVLLAMVGEGLLNDAAKAFYGRERPALWNTATRSMWFGFPSGHAMASMALGTVLVVLTWRTRLRWPVLAFAVLLVLAVSGSRLYLGVHYPSDVVAAWFASLAWVFGLRLLVLPRGHRSPRTPG